MADYGNDPNDQGNDAPDYGNNAPDYGNNAPDYGNNAPDSGSAPTDSGGDVTIYYEPQGCNCANKTTYDGNAIHAACAQALSLASQGQQIGYDKYPHAYNDNEHFPFKHAQPPYFEFPIMPDGSVYEGNRSPGTDRVVIGSVAADYSSAVYCAIITHDGSSRRNGFVECKDDTVNTDGEGEWDTSLTQGEGLAPREDRELLRNEHVRVPWHQPSVL